jgi:hypothetical protein
MAANTSSGKMRRIDKPYTLCRCDRLWVIEAALGPAKTSTWTGT